MNTYRISCYSKCGSYFQPYLQYVTVNAISKAEAIRLCKEWLVQTAKEFELPESEWTIADVTNNQQSRVVDYLGDSDY